MFKLKKQPNQKKILVYRDNHFTNFLICIIFEFLKILNIFYILIFHSLLYFTLVFLKYAM